MNTDWNAADEYLTQGVKQPNATAFSNTECVLKKCCKKYKKGKRCKNCPDK